MKQRCNVTGKLMLGDRRQAKEALKFWGWAKGSRRVFRCIFCDEYHMSSAKRGTWQPVGGRGA